MTTTQIAMDIHRKVQSSNKEWLNAAVFRKHTGWKGAAASDLAFTLRNAELNYVSATISDHDDEDAVVRVIAFTSADVVVVTVSEATSSTVIPRSALIGVTLHEVPRLLEPDSYAHGSLRLELDYGVALASQPKLILGNKYQTPVNMDELDAFLPALLTDLHLSI